MCSKYKLNPLTFTNSECEIRVQLFHYGNDTQVITNLALFILTRATKLMNTLLFCKTDRQCQYHLRLFEWSFNFACTHKGDMATQQEKRFRRRPSLKNICKVRILNFSPPVIHKFRVLRPFSPI